ncbi:2-succinyl-5-enolpyruvyl-6-hydroxy-3-cyclohexene-1-carboxylate synthase [Arcicella aurantiaca]|uniref:2-succinyl-5-enolpyruvyl-6-hydroxy-3-cyclohexene-1-carboxylate synthase n=1 Tax=Arcicella aurantiaca TaxID=591202 RepID=A0A316DQL0_9BACT|nr:2-succinyl-5-enolpyruvyl-6-hydroxy-3-cyclohexene-1-carboxylic-acid synthase [Arcicella aurantiaca]PWK20255.1 2-succinyl-5-enolpyruvyl-6-hydroxy-3-cyclohexene-1-carboxylate synthase [Arcicella aurantiaca]
MLLQPIVNFINILAKKGVKNAIISPGSRNAPLTIALVRHPDIETKSISDERSAAFIALGMAQNLKEPVAICCTSGSAAYNYAPAVAEAFFQEIPLIILTADRPKEWIHQNDGQTIYQTDIFGKHVKKSFEIGADYSHSDAVWQIERTINDAVNLANIEPCGPVHINIPLREPFYPAENEEISFNVNSRVIEIVRSERTLSKESWHQLLTQFQDYDNILIAGGQSDKNDNLASVLNKLQDEFQIVCIGDSISNMGFEAISKHDLFLKVDAENLKPDLLITYGKSFISKGLKTFLRKNKAIEHWHLQIGDHLIDTFQSVTKIIPLQPIDFFTKLYEDLDFEQFRNGEEERNESFKKEWFNLEQKANIYLERFFQNEPQNFNEFFAIKYLMDALPANCQLHLANSMSVRYANYIGVNPKKNIEVFANRGTSGIDGCVSTAVGAALSTDKLVFLLVGDVAFFYDRNGLWNRYLPKNLRIILLNNHGGGIFRMIDGPSKQPELNDYFETLQTMNAQNTALDAEVEYLKVINYSELINQSVLFLDIEGKSKILEIETNSKINTEVFKEFKTNF